MFAIVALLIADPLPRLTTEVEVSAGVRAAVKTHGKTLSPELVEQLSQLQRSGDSSAAVFLGELIARQDRPGGPDYKTACDQYEAGKAHVEGLHNLATCYFKGQGRPLDRERARELYRQASTGGLAKSACAYGNMLIRGDGGVTDVAHGLALCRSAADAGDADAQTDLGGYLLTGKFSDRDPKTAVHYLKLAAEKKHANAAFLLGQAYYKGDGVDKSVGEAGAMWLTAYDGGRADAAFLLGWAAFNVVLDGAKSKQPVPTGMIGQSRKWLAIAEERDPDRTQRQKATELLQLLEKLLVNSTSARQ